MKTAMDKWISVKEIICFFKDHDADETGNCDRCDKDYNYWIETLPARLYHCRRKLSEWIFSRCITCDKPDRFCGKEIGNHDNCLPF